MNDTAPAITEKIEAMMRRKEPAERLAMGCSMFGFAQQLVKSSILMEKPGISSADLRKEVFLRFYENDFTKEQREKIIAHLKAHTPPAGPDGTLGKT